MQGEVDTEGMAFKTPAPFVLAPGGTEDAEVLVLRIAAEPPVGTFDGSQDSFERAYILGGF